jgi:hypothetical protein
MRPTTTPNSPPSPGLERAEDPIVEILQHRPSLGLDCSSLRRSHRGWGAVQRKPRPRAVIVATDVDDEASCLLNTAHRSVTGPTTSRTWPGSPRARSKRKRSARFGHRRLPLWRWSPVRPIGPGTFARGHAGPRVLEGVVRSSGRSRPGDSTFRWRAVHHDDNKAFRTSQCVLTERAAAAIPHTYHTVAPPPSLSTRHADTGLCPEPSATQGVF